VGVLALCGQIGICLLEVGETVTDKRFGPSMCVGSDQTTVALNWRKCYMIVKSSDLNICAAKWTSIPG
jgi:hypothetical protein